MTLAELLRGLEHVDNDLTIYASALPMWNPDSEAAALINPDDSAHPITVSGIQMEYLLEVFIAKEILEDWQDWRGGKVLSAEEMCEVVIYYATHDAFMPQ
jgi:hypothetical protein